MRSSGNAYRTVEYAREIVRGSTTEKVLIDRAALKALVGLAVASPRYRTARGNIARLARQARDKGYGHG